MQKRNPYKILGLKKGASSEEIKDAFMYLIKKSKPMNMNCSDKIIVLKKEMIAKLQSYFTNLTTEEVFCFKLNINIAKIQVDVIIEKIYRSNREDEIKRLFKAGNLIINELASVIKSSCYEEATEVLENNIVSR